MGSACMRESRSRCHACVYIFECKRIFDQHFHRRLGLVSGLIFEAPSLPVCCDLQVGDRLDEPGFYKAAEPCFSPSPESALILFLLCQALKELWNQWKLAHADSNKDRTSKVG